MLNQIAGELDIDGAAANLIRAEYHDRLSAVQQLRRVSGKG